MTIQSTSEVYLGDGLYASFDGFQYRLRAPREFGGNHEVFLDPDVLEAFDQFRAQVEKERST